jgi:serine/threonine-protein kinase
MGLSAGMRLGAYEVVSLLGAGGMGEVYRARDSRLKREVALKVLPVAFSLDADRLGRFQREAEILAALNHPNIAAIYGLEKSDAGMAIVLELVDGETLADVIGRGPIPVAEALPIARAIADALEAAHDRGIVHRDLKPANVKITSDGKVKVLDFGLAKAVDAAGQLYLSHPRGSVEQDPPYGVTQSPTITTPALTYAGVILGTAAYMSPEQARGKPVDRRADIWTFGCVLYEMLTGRRTFDAGDTVSDAIAAILKQDPDWTALPSDTPPHIRTLLKRCLQKDPQKRLPHIGVARLEIDEGPPERSPAEIPVAASPRRTKRLILIVAATATLAAVVAAGLTWWFNRMKPTAPPMMRFVHTLSPGQTFSSPFLKILAISPDGKQMVYVTNQRLYLRSLSDLAAAPINETEIDGAGNIGYPVFSPDGESITYWVRSATTSSIANVGVLKKIGAHGGAAVTLAEVGLPFGMSWGDTGILVSPLGKGIVRVSPNGGMPEQLIPAKNDELMLGPQLLPGGDDVLFTLARQTAGLTSEEVWSKAQIVVQSLKTGQRKTLLEHATDAHYLPTGHLVYVMDGVLMARTFDLRGQTVGEAAIPVVEGVALSRLGELFSGSAQLSVSDTGSLIYVPGNAERQRELIMVDRSGTITPLKLPPALYQHPRVSPDGQQVTYYIDDGKTSAVYAYELSGATAPRRLTFEGRNRFPIWTRDGQRITYQSVRNGKPTIYWERADSTEPGAALVESEADMNPIPNAWTPDGKILFYENGKVRPISTSFDSVDVDHALWTFSVADKKTVPLGDVHGISAIAPIAATISRDGRWIVYTVGAGATRAGLQTFAQQLPKGGRHLVATGAADAVWHPRGNELYFLNLLGQWGLSVTVATQPQFAVGNPVPLPMGLSNVLRRSRTGVGSSRNFDITPDGEHFVAAVERDLSEGTPPQINVVLNWFEELKARVPN